MTITYFQLQMVHANTAPHWKSSTVPENLELWVLISILEIITISEMLFAGLLRM